MKVVLLLLLSPIPAAAQFTLMLPDGSPVPPTYGIGRVYSGEIASAQLRIRNTSSAPATLYSLTLAGVGFTLSAPQVPAGIAAQGALDFSVNFRATDTGTYSAVLIADGISALLTATVMPGLTYRLDGALLSAIDFGNIIRGTSAQRRISIRNETTTPATVPAIFVTGAGFALGGQPPSGQSLQPLDSTEVTVTFQPSAVGERQGVLTIGDRAYGLGGIGIDPPLPRISAALELAAPSSAQQGRLVINFESPAQIPGLGTATIDFRGAPDSGIAFAAGGRTATFAVAIGDTQAVLPFQTGTSAGTLTFTIELGNSTAQQTVNIAPAPVIVANAQASRTARTIDLRVTGFDNTRTLGTIVFTFYDNTGRAFAQAHSDAGPDFAAYFATSDAGGQFLLRATFPVTGDATQISACDVGLVNSAGTTLQRVLIQ